MEMMILSLNAPAVQAIPDPRRAIEIARRANDFLAEQVRKRPQRFQALAALPMQDPDLASTRARTLRQGARLRGRAGQRLLADRRCRVTPSTTTCRSTGRSGARSKQLDVPFYLHPRNPLPGWSQIYEGHAWLLGPTWAFAQETAVHALRLMGSGLFDDYPGSRSSLGIMGEGLPYSMWRIDNRNAWVKAPPKYPAKKKIADYFHAQFLPDHVGQFPHADADRRHAGGRR